jgi:hypothetical protein
VALVIRDLKQTLEKGPPEREESDKVNLLIENAYFDPECRELYQLRRAQASVKFEIMTWRLIRLAEKGGYKVVIGNILSLIAVAAWNAKVERCLSRQTRIVARLYT